MQLEAAKATFNRSGSLAAALCQIAADIVLGAAEHAQGFGIITARYRITPKGFASEVTVRNPDGFSATRTFYLSELLFPPPARVALVKDHRPVPKEQADQYLQIEREFQRDPSVQEAVVVSLGHKVGSNRNWMYIFSRDPSDPSSVRLVAIRLPDDPVAALAFRDRVLAARNLSALIPREPRTGHVILRGDGPMITAQDVAAAARGGLFGISAKEFASLGKDGFDILQQRQSAEIEALAQYLLRMVDEADCDTVDEKFALAMQLCGHYLLNTALRFSRDATDAGRREGGSDADEPAAASRMTDKSEISQSIDLTVDTVPEMITQAESEGPSSQELAERAQEDADEEAYTLSAEVESGDDGYQPVVAIEEFDLAESVRESSAELEEEDSQLNLVLDLATEDSLTEEPVESAAEEELVTLEDGAEPGAEQDRLRELFEELGGDLSLLGADTDEVSPLAMLIADGDIPAFSEIGEFNELLLAAEITDTVSADFEDELDDEDVVDGDGSGDPDGAAGGSEPRDEADATEHGADRSENAELDVTERVAQENAEADTDNESRLGRSSDAEEVEDDDDSEELEAALVDRDADLADEGVYHTRHGKAVRRRAAIRALNRLRAQAEDIGINVFEILKLRQRRGLKRLWFEQLVFALAREMNFNFEQRQELARELELSGADFDDIRQAELAVRRELHARKMRTKLLEAIQNQ